MEVLSRSRPTQYTVIHHYISRSTTIHNRTSPNGRGVNRYDTQRTLHATDIGGGYTRFRSCNMPDSHCRLGCGRRSDYGTQTGTRRPPYISDSLTPTARSSPMSITKPFDMSGASLIEICRCPGLRKGFIHRCTSAMDGAARP